MSIDETMQKMSENLFEVIEALECMIAVLYGRKFEELSEAAIDAEIVAVRKKPSYPVIKIILMPSTGLKSETITRTLIPL